MGNAQHHHHHHQNNDQSQQVYDRVVQFNEAKLQVPAMFFCWLSYSTMLLGNCVGTQYSYDQGNNLLKGYGTWSIVHEFVRNSKLEIVRVFIVVNEEKKQVIVSFRGTKFEKDHKKSVVNDWIFGNMDARLKKWRKDLDTGKCHSGFMRHYKSVGYKLMAQVKHYLIRGYLVTFSGHSQGGALSLLGALQCAEEMNSFKDQIFVITFASPNIGNKSFVQYYQSYIPESHIVQYITYKSAKVPILDSVTLVPPTAVGLYKRIKSNRKFIKTDKSMEIDLKIIDEDLGSMPIGFRIHAQECK
jgi:hypothetical protein